MIGQTCMYVKRIICMDILIIAIDGIPPESAREVWIRSGRGFGFTETVRNPDRQ
jgi:hypothetical protein